MPELIDQYFEAIPTFTPRESSEERDAVAALRSTISEGSFAPGDKLPAERELTSTLGVRRSTLRKALDVLEREGVIWRHVGKGTFVAKGSDDAGQGLIAALSQQMTPLRMVQARLCVEPSLAREAAIHASREAIARIRLARDGAKNAATWADYEAQDDLFHRAVALSSDNMLLVLLFDQLNHVRRTISGTTVVRGPSRPPRDHSSFAEHDAILAAIEAHDAVAARDAMRSHIGSVSDRLFGQE